MNRFKHNTERWMRNQAKIYTTRGNTGMACVFERCADDVATFRAQLAESERRREELVEAVNKERELETTATLDSPDEHMDALLAARAEVDRLMGGE